MNSNDVRLTQEECEAIFETLDILSGGNADSCFGWDGTDDPTDPSVSGFAKIWAALDREIPEELEC